MQRTLYLTGFGPFEGVQENPTKGLVQRLNGEYFGPFLVHAEVLPVSFARATRMVRQRLTDLQPSRVVHLGVAVSAEQIRLERWAVNCAHSEKPDVDGHVHESCALDPTMPINHTRRSTAKIDALLAQLNAAGFATCASDDAGRYVCNSTYFHALGLRPDALFVHVPLPDAERNNWTAQRLDDAIRTLLHAIGDTSRQHV